MIKVIKDLYVNKAQYLENEIIEVVIELNQNLENNEYETVLTLTNMNKVISKTSKTINIQSLLQNQIVIELEPLKSSGYGLDIDVYKNKELIQTISTAFDVVKTHKDSPRYGFLSDFGEEDQYDDLDIINMKKLHLNMIQFYDWMYRHDNLVSDEESYKDLMGKKMSKNAIMHKINLCHENGMKAIAYGAIYAASKDFFEKHKDWALYYSNNEAVSFIDIFYIMNIQKECPWHKHIINEYEKAITLLDFDGIHMDTYGYPKKAISLWEDKREMVYLDKEFPILINDTKEQLQNVKEDITLIFNNVGNWPVKSTAFSNQDMIYVEVWDPYNTYDHLQEIIQVAKELTDKPVILAAYLKPFMNENHENAGYALKILTAAIISNGAYHLILGENQGVLTQGYYVDYYKLESNLFLEMRKYYDFMIRYSDLFYNKNLKDVSMTHAYGDNMEYVFEGDEFSASADSNKIWTIIKEDQDTKIISLINLKGNDVLWNKGKMKPNEISDICIKIQIEKEVDSVYIASPEKSIPCDIPYKITEGERGKILNLNLKDIDLWTIVVIKLTCSSEV